MLDMRCLFEYRGAGIENESQRNSEKVSGNDSGSVSLLRLRRQNHHRGYIQNRQRDYYQKRNEKSGRF
jgi:hypothetical protein